MPPQRCTKRTLFLLPLLDFGGEPVVAETDVVKGPLIFAEAVEQASRFVALLPFGNNGLSQVKKPRHGILLLVEEQH